MAALSDKLAKKKKEEEQKKADVAKPKTVAPVQKPSTTSPKSAVTPQSTPKPISKPSAKQTFGDKWMDYVKQKTINHYTGQGFKFNPDPAFTAQYGDLSFPSTPGAKAQIANYMGSDQNLYGRNNNFSAMGLQNDLAAAYKQAGIDIGSKGYAADRNARAIIASQLGISPDELTPEMMQEHAGKIISEKQAQTDRAFAIGGVRTGDMAYMDTLGNEPALQEELDRNARIYGYQRIGGMLNNKMVAGQGTDAMHYDNVYDKQRERSASKWGRQYDPESEEDIAALKGGATTYAEQMKRNKAYTDDDLQTDIGRIQDYVRDQISNSRFGDTGNNPLNAPLAQQAMRRLNAFFGKDMSPEDGADLDEWANSIRSAYQGKQKLVSDYVGNMSVSAPNRSVDEIKQIQDEVNQIGAYLQSGDTAMAEQTATDLMMRTGNDDIGVPTADNFEQWKQTLNLYLNQGQKISYEDYSSYLDSREDALKQMEHEQQFVADAEKNISEKWGYLKDNSENASIGAAEFSEEEKSDPYLGNVIKLLEAAGKGDNAAYDKIFYDISRTREMDPAYASAAYLENSLKYIDAGQLASFKTILRTEGFDKAFEYLRDLKPLLNKKEYEDRAVMEQQYAEEHPFLASISSTGLNAVNSAQGIGNAFRGLFGVEVNEYDPSFWAGQFSGIERGTVSKKIENLAPGIVGKGASMLYNAAMSSIDSFINSTMFGTGGAAVMATGAYNTGLHDAIAEGNMHPQLTAAVRGAIEFGTEHAYLSKLLDTKLMDKGTLGYLLGTALSEGYEEGLSDVLNLGFDSFMNQIGGTNSKEYNELINRGYTHDAAMAMLQADFTKQLIEDMLVGGISGEMGGMMQLTINKANDISTGRTIDNNNAVNNLLDVADSVLTDDERAAEISAGLRAELENQQKQATQPKKEKVRPAQIDETQVKSEQQTEQQAEEEQKPAEQQREEQAEDDGYVEDEEAAPEAEKPAEETSEKPAEEPAPEDVASNGKPKKSGFWSDMKRAADIGYLFRQTMEKLDAQARETFGEGFKNSVVRDMLRSVGVTENDQVKAYADTIVNLMTNPDIVSQAEKSNLGNNQGAFSVLYDLIGKAGRMKQINEKIGEVASWVVKGNVQSTKPTISNQERETDAPVSEVQTAMPDMTPNELEQEFDSLTKNVDEAAKGIKTSEDGTTKLDDGTEVTLAGDQRPNFEGELTIPVKTSDGEVKYVKPSEVTFSEADAGNFKAMLYASKYGSNADLVYSMLENSENLEQDALNVRKAFQAGVDGNLSAESNIEGISHTNFGISYEIGKALRLNILNNRQNSNFDNAKNVVKYGSINTSEIRGIELTPRQKRQITGVNLIAEVTGLNVEWFASGTEEVANDKGEVTVKRSGANGSYNPKTRTVRLDIYAGTNLANDLNTAIMQTFDHELTHHIFQYANADHVAAYTEFVMSHLSEKMGADVLEEKIKQIQSEQGLSRLDAIEEIVADASGDNLLHITPDTLKQLASENPSLVKRIANYMKTALKKMAARIRKAFSGTKNYYDVGVAMADYLEEQAKMWNDLLVEATQNARLVDELVGMGKDKAVENSIVIESAKAKTDGTPYDAGIGGIKYSARVTDGNTLSFLDNQKTITTYRSMQLIDGKLYPPMATVVAGSKEDASEIGKWEQATEHPELIKFDEKGKPQFMLYKGKGNGTPVKAAYNPYMHSSNLVLNDQFSGAWARPNLVVVECAVPESELTSGYHAQYAKDSVGWHSWHTGTVAGKLRAVKGIERQVFLSRYIKPVRILDYSEVAQMYADLLNDADIAVPDNVVPPKLLEALKEAGVNITISGKVKTDTANETKYSLRDGEYANAVDSGDMKTAQRMVDEAAEQAMPNSKVRDKKGKLLPVYHGTNAEFNVFDTTKQGGVNGTAEGYGIYLSDTQDVTNSYGNRQIKAYVNITKPATSYKRTLTSAQIAKVIKATCEQEARQMVADGDYDSINDALRDTWISNYVDTYSGTIAVSYREAANSIREMNDNDMDIVHEIMSGMAIRKYDDAMRFYSEILTPTTGIDGFATNWNNHGSSAQIFLAFNSNQIKEADPATYDDSGDLIPLSERFNSENADIRYSARSDGEYRGRNPRDVAFTEGDQVNAFYGALSPSEWRLYYDKVGKDSSLNLDLFNHGDKAIVYAGNKAVVVEYVEKGNGLTNELEGDFEVIGVYKSESRDFEHKYDIGDEMGYDESEIANWVQGAEDDDGKALFSRYDHQHNGFVPISEWGRKKRVAQGNVQLSSGRNTQRARSSQVHSAEDERTTPRDLWVSNKKSGDAFRDMMYERALRNGDLETASRWVARRAEYKGFDVDESSGYAVDSRGRQKSMDVVTYDDNGDPIQLSDRFNKRKKDVRYSLRDNDRFSTESDDIRNQARELTDRERLANAFDDIAENQNELDFLKRYRDKAQALTDKETKLADTMRQITELNRSKSKADKAKAAGLREAAAILEKQINRMDSELLKFQTAKPLQDVLKRTKATSYSKGRAVQRDIANRQLERQKAYDRAREERHVEAVRESYGKQTHRDRLDKDLGTLYDWVVNPTNKAYVPEFLRGDIKEFIEGLNRSSMRLLKKGEQTKKDTKWLEAMERMRRKISDAVSGQMNLDTALGANYFEGYLDLPESYVDEFDSLVSDMRNTIANSDNLTETPINLMTAAQLKQMSKLVKQLMTSVRNMDRLLSTAAFAHVSDAAQSSMQKLDAMTENKHTDDLVAKARDFMTFDNMTPAYAFKRFGKGGEAIFEGFQNGWDKLAFKAKAIIDFSEDTYTSAEVKAWESEAHTIKLDGGTFTMTTAQIMSLYELAKREQAMKHLGMGGMRVGTYKDAKGKNVNQTQDFRLTTDDIDAITGKLTARQKEVANKLQRYMVDECASWGNEVSMRRFGYKIFTEQNYFPIQSDSNNLRAVSEQATETSMYRLLNLSATKELNVKANNAIMANSIFDVFAAHTADMAKYNALALPILDAMKWLNYRTKTATEDGKFSSSSLQRSLERAYGNAAKKYITNLIKDLNGVSETGRHDGKMKGLMSKYKVAAVAGNFRVWALQATSMPRAAVAINPKYLLKAMGTGSSWAITKGGTKAGQAASDNVGIAQWKELGFYDTNVGRDIREQIKHADTAVGKIRNASMAPAGWGDNWTMGIIYNAVQHELADTRRDLVKGSDEYNKALNDRVRQIVYETQVVDSTLTRSDMMRSHGMSEIWTAFMSEPTLTMSMLTNAVNRVIENKRAGMSNREALRKAGKTLLRVSSVWALSQVVTSLCEAVFSAMRDDDDYEEWDEKFKSAWRENLLTDVNPLNNIPIVKDIYSALTGDSVERMDMQVYKDAYDTAKIYGDILKGTSSFDYRALYKTLTWLSRGTGLPISNLTRDGVSFINTFVANAIGMPKIQTYPDSKGTVAEKYYDAYKEGNEAAMLYLTERMKVNGLDYDAIDEKFTEKVKNDYLSGAIDFQTATEYLQDLSNLTPDKAEDKVGGWDYNIQTGRKWDNRKADYISGDVSRDDMAAYLMTIGNKTADKAEEQLKKWDYNKETGRDFDDMKADYIAGTISAAEAKKLLMKYAGKTADSAAEQIDRWDFAAKHNGSDDNYAMAWRAWDAFDKGNSKLAGQELAKLLTPNREKGNISRMISDKYKKQYIAIKGTAKGNQMLEALIDMYVAIGYGRDERRRWIAKNWK